MMDSKEIWKSIKGYEDFYEVSNLGNVRSLKREAWNGKVFHEIKGRTLKPIRAGKYHCVQLSVNGKVRKYYLHRLVAQTFLNNPLNKKEVNHINGNKFDNHLENLEWVTRQENEKHAWEIGLKNSVGKDHPNCKFSDETISLMRSDYATGNYKQNEIAKKYGVSKMQTHRILKNKIRSEVI